MALLSWACLALQMDAPCGRRAFPFSLDRMVELALIPLTPFSRSQEKGENPSVGVSAPLAQRFWERGRGRGPLCADNGKALPCGRRHLRSVWRSTIMP